ncbi:MAG: hypothetical protein MZU97_24630 [Bacillus subtilis]|nr:hypothetical protein [Bacillus subtilis]
MSKLVLTAKGTQPPPVRRRFAPDSASKPIHMRLRSRSTASTYQIDSSASAAPSPKAPVTTSTASTRPSAKRRSAPISIPRTASATTSAASRSTAATFRCRRYTYIEEGDAELKTFDIARDRELRRSRSIKQRRRSSRRSRFACSASPWTPPAFMKDNNSPIRGGHLLETIRRRVGPLLRPFRPRIPQGRPDRSGGSRSKTNRRPSSAGIRASIRGEQERDFVKNHLGPGCSRPRTVSDVEDPGLGPQPRHHRRARGRRS